MVSKKIMGIASMAVLISWNCTVPSKSISSSRVELPQAYSSKSDTFNFAELSWREYFEDSVLLALIDTALHNNRELQIMMQEIEISRNEVKAKKGEYLPFAGIKAGSGLDKNGLYTRHGAVDEQLEIEPGKKFPAPFGDWNIGVMASWEPDIWNKLRNAKKATVHKYLASQEGKNFMQTQLIAEIAENYYELLAYDNLNEIIRRNIQIQTNALEVVKQQKDAAKLTQLAVNRFEAQLLNTQNLQYEVKQRIVENQNRIHFLCGKFPSDIQRNSSQFLELGNDSLNIGLPSQLLLNRPDIRQAEQILHASGLKVLSARANFFPQLGIKAGLGFQAFNPAYLLHPESIMYNLAGDLIAPLINRNAIKSEYANAKSAQLQSLMSYEQTILYAYTDVLNQMSGIQNYSQSFTTKKKEVEILTQSVSIANSLFTFARADYAEVLLTQREALESKMELIEIKMKLLKSRVNIYRALGGGWR